MFLCWWIATYIRFIPILLWPNIYAGRDKISTEFAQYDTYVWIHVSVQGVENNDNCENSPFILFWDCYMFWCYILLYLQSSLLSNVPREIYCLALLHSFSLHKGVLLSSHSWDVNLLVLLVAFMVIHQSNWSYFGLGILISELIFHIFWVCYGFRAMSSLLYYT